MKLKRLSLSTKSKETKQASAVPPIRAQGLYNYEVSFPPGIQNSGNSCYANSVFQCLLHHPTFNDLANDIVAHHNKAECRLCNDPGDVKYIIMLVR